MARSRASSGSPTGQRQQPGSARRCRIQCPVPPNPATQTRCPWRQRSPAEFSTQALPLRPGQQPNARSGSRYGPLVLPNGLRGRGASPKCSLTPLPPKSLPPPSARGPGADPAGAAVAGHRAYPPGTGQAHPGRAGGCGEVLILIPTLSPGHRAAPGCSSGPRRSARALRPAGLGGRPSGEAPAPSR